MKTIKCDKIITPDGLKNGYLTFEDGKIVGFAQKGVADYDFTGKYLAPGFIELHTHGAGGFSFMDGSWEDVVNGCNYQLAFGVTTILPTVSTGAFASMREAVKNIAKAKQSGLVKNRLHGAHMEGPYLSLNQVGAQSPENITPPKAEEYEPLLEEFGDVIARWTYAPENDAGNKFGEYVSKKGVVLSAGHSDAKYADLKRAQEVGCNLITHLYSATSTVTRDHGFRSLGVIETAFLCDEIFVEIIADGKHLPPELINMILKIKGSDRVALVTDSMAIAGTSVKEGSLSGIDYIVEDGVCKLKDRSAFAGSVATANMLIRTLVQSCGQSVETAVKMLTETPAKILGLTDRGRLEKGMFADMVAFNTDFSVTDVFVDGEKIK